MNAPEMGGCTRCGSRYTIGVCSVEACGVKCETHFDACGNCKKKFCTDHLKPHLEPGQPCGPKKPEPLETEKETSPETDKPEPKKEPEEAAEDKPKVESESSVIHPPTLFKPETSWGCSVKLLDTEIPLKVQVESGCGWLRGGIYHDISWCGVSPLPLCASRFQLSTKEIGDTLQPVPTFLGICKQNVTMRIFECVCQGISPYYLIERGNSVMFIEIATHVQELLGFGGTLKGCKLKKREGEFHIFDQFIEIHELCLSKKPVWGILELARSFCISEHPIGGGFYGNIKLLAWDIDLDLEFIIDQCNSMEGLDKEPWQHLAGVWCRVCELLIAFRSGTIGCRSVYERLERIDGVLRTASKTLTGKTKPFSIWDRAASWIISIRNWATNCRALMNQLLRQSIHRLDPCGAGGRWDITKEDIVPEHHLPSFNPFSNYEIGTTAQSIVEAHTACTLANMGAPFVLKKPTKRETPQLSHYIVCKGPTLKQVQSFTNFKNTINGSSVEETIKPKLISCCTLNLGLWNRVIACVTADEKDARLRTRDVRGFSSSTKDVMDQFLERVGSEMGDILKTLFPVSGLSGIKDGEYWDADGFPWDQKTMFDPILIRGLDFDKAVGEFVATVRKQARDAHDGHITFKDGKTSSLIGIMIEATFVGPRVYQCIWAKLYEEFDLGSIPFVGEKGKPLVRDVISPTALPLLTPFCAYSQSGLPGILNAVVLMVGTTRTVTFVNLKKFLSRHCDCYDLPATVSEKLSLSWDWHKDYQHQLPVPGIFFEVGFKYKNLLEGEVACRLLINPAKKTIIFCPLHYIPYMTPTGDKTGTVHSYMITVVFEEKDAEEKAKMFTKFESETS